MDRGRSRKKNKVKTSNSGPPLTVTLVNVLVICVVLFFAVSLGDGSFTSRINKISDHLNKALDEVLFVGNVNFTDLEVNVTYNSKTDFNPRGMADLYFITQTFIDLIANKEIFPKGFISVKDGAIQIESLADQWQALLVYYIGVVVVVIVLLLLAILMPLCGFFFCCCRCCGRCGARSKPFDKKGDLCRKIVLAFLMIVMGTLLLFGVVCAFVSNQHMQDGTNELTTTFRTGVSDADTFIKATNSQITTLLGVNYVEFKEVLFDTLNQCSDIVLEQLGEYSNATALTEVVNIVNGLDGIKTNLTFMKTVTRELQVNASQLNDGLRSVKRSLLQTLMNCTHTIPGCDELSNNVSRLGTEIDFNAYLDRYFPKLPDISDQIDELNKVLEANITSTVMKGQEAFENIRIEINTTISSQMPKVKSAINDAGEAISQGSSNITSVLTNVSIVLTTQTDKPLNNLDRYINDFTPYRYYLGIAASAVLLLVTVCVTLGLICGICGKRPDAYSDDCCNKGAGSKFLMTGVAVMFLLSFLLALVTCIYFIAGVVAQRLVCDPIRYPNSSSTVDLLDDFLQQQIQSSVLNFSVKNAIASCHNNETVYRVLGLQSAFNIEDVTNYLDKFSINDTLAELMSKIQANTKVVLLDDTAKGQLLQLVDSGIANIGYDKFIDELKLAQNLTSVSLTFLISKLEELVKAVEEKLDDSQEIVSSLRLNAFHLHTYQVMLVEPMTTKSKEMIVVAETLKESLKFGKSSFEVAINDLIAELLEAQEYLQKNGTDTLRQIAVNFIAGVETQIKSYLERVVNKTLYSIGQCYPVSLVLNATLTATCDKILQPWNGYWFSMLWSLLVFIPTIILSVKLAYLYQKYEPYPGALVESEYLHDVYMDRDNIPLHSPAGKYTKKKKYKKKSKRLDGRGAYVAEGAERTTPAPSGSAYPDARYADMAPKHWEEFPNGGPPQYQRAPTEYERPPPYYYPGTEQQQ